MLTHAEILQRLTYDPLTGEFHWKAGVRSRPEGSRAGRFDTGTGYWRITVKGKVYYAHRLAWFYVHGEWPPALIDHDDRNKLNNRIANLVPAGGSANQLNRSNTSANSSGLCGVTKWGDKWRAQLMVDRKQHYLGLFDTPEEAHEVYLEQRKLAKEAKRALQRVAPA